MQLTKRPLYGLIVSVAVALVSIWAGLFIAWYEQYPPSFFIVTISFALYVAVRGSFALSLDLFARARSDFPGLRDATASPESG